MIVHRRHLLALLTLSISVPRSFKAAAALAAPSTGPFKIQGIYVQQGVAQSPQRLDHLINNSVQSGVTTLGVDLCGAPSPNYKKAVERIQQHGLQYVPRITMFPDGGKHEQIVSREYWEQRWKLASYGLDLGAKDIQLDYIRYSSKT